MLVCSLGHCSCRRAQWKTFFFFSYYWLQQNFCSGHSHRLGTFTATLQVSVRGCVYVGNTWGLCHVCAQLGLAWGWCCVWLRGHPSCAPGQNSSKGSSSRLSLKEVRVIQSKRCENQPKASFDQSLVFKKTIFLLPQI